MKKLFSLCTVLSLTVICFGQVEVDSANSGRVSIGYDTTMDANTTPVIINKFSTANIKIRSNTVTGWVGGFTTGNGNILLDVMPHKNISGNYNIIVGEISGELFFAKNREDKDMLWCVDFDCSFFKDNPILKGIFKMYKDLAVGTAMDTEGRRKELMDLISQQGIFKNNPNRGKSNINNSKELIRVLDSCYIEKTSLLILKTYPSFYGNGMGLEMR